MAGHAPAGEDQIWRDADGHHRRRTCTCGEVFEGDGRSELDAQVAAQTAFSLHLQGD